MFPPAAASAQSGFASDGFDPAPGHEDLFSCRSPIIVPEQVEAALGTDWAWHLLGIDRPDATEWTVEQRLSGFASLAYAPLSSLKLSLSFGGAALQRGRRTDESGAAASLEAADGDVWLSALWAPLGSQDTVLSSAVETGLRLGTAAPSGLTGDSGAGVRTGGILALHIDWLRLILNLGVITRKRTVFRDLEIDDGLYYRLGVEFADLGIPLRFFSELTGETRLHSPFSSRTSQIMETFLGVRLEIGEFGVVVGAGAGLLGARSPAARVLLLVKWAAGGEKRDVQRE
jgi:hypothetical protein